MPPGSQSSVGAAAGCPDLALGPPVSAHLLISLQEVVLAASLQYLWMIKGQGS